MQILVSGSLAYDRIMDFPGKFGDHILPEKIHILNVCFVVNGLSEKFGGTAGNIAYSLALLEEKPLILATCGKDFDRYQKWLEQIGLDLTGIRCIEDEFTAGAYITTDMADNQITGFNPGAMNHTSEFDFDGLPAGDKVAIISPGNTDDMLRYSRSYKERKVPYIFDPGQQIPALGGERIQEIINGAQLVISNDYELEMIKKATNWDTGDILERADAVITTLGENGSLVITPEATTEIAAAKADRVIDPTGAGDAYRSGLLKGLVLGRDLADAAQWGAVCASFAVECYGTQEHRFDMPTFTARYDRNFV